MQFSCYHYHSNSISQIFIFVKNENLIRMNLMFMYDIGDYEEEITFVMSEDKMKKYPTLYNMYLMSLILTMDTTQLFVCEDGFGIYKKKIWKGIRITNEYDMMYTYMDDIPDDFEESDDEYLNTYVKFLEMRNTDFTKLLEKEFEQQIDNIEKELKQYEKDVYVSKARVMFAKKVISHYLPNDLEKNILEKLL